MENIPFLIARRRNEHQRNGRLWIAKLEKSIGIQPGVVQLLPAEDSVLREGQWGPLKDQLSLAGTFVRRSSISLTSASDIWDGALATNPSEVLVCNMVNYPDFTFTVPAIMLLHKLKILLEFDGDTVGASSMDLSKGLEVDMYVDANQTLCEVDQWGPLVVST